MFRIQGRCHCSNISFELEWHGDASAIPARACSCSFCTKHGGRWTSHPSSKLSVRVADPALVEAYRFGTKTADFHVCRRCGVVPVVTTENEGVLYAVVNVNTFDNVERSALKESSASFDGEGVGDRMARRTRNWIATVTFASGQPSSSPAVQ